MPITTKIYSENNDFQRFETLKRNREKRHRFSEFLVEGVISLNSLINSDWEIRAFVYSSKRGLSDWGKGILANSRAEQHYDILPELLEKLSDKEETSELMAIARIPGEDMSRIHFDSESVLVVLDRPANPGNLGTSIRTCEALGAAGIVITGHATCLYHPHCVRGSMGALFNLPVIRLPSQNELLLWVTEQRKNLPSLQILGTSAQAKTHLNDFHFAGPTILAFGNETHGLSRGYQELCDHLLKIPLRGKSSSLNVSNAVAIILYQAVCRTHQS